MIFGLPIHPLVVHAAVILMPIASLAALVMSYLPSFSRRYGKLVFGLSIIGLISLFAARWSGEELKEIVGVEIERHQNLGNLAPFISIPLVALIYLRWRMDREGANIGSPAIRRLVSIFLVIASLISLTYVALSGHSGAELVWGWVSKN
jgi:energy-coupling factor transporter transmembrane protein EcfT